MPDPVPGPSHGPTHPVFSTALSRGNCRFPGSAVQEAKTLSLVTCPPPTPPTAPAVTPPGLNRAAPPSQALCKGLLGITVLLPLSFPPPFIQQLLIESLPCATYRQLNRNKKRRKSKMQFSPCNLQMRGLRPEEVTCSGSPSKSGAGSWL